MLLFTDSLKKESRKNVFRIIFCGITMKQYIKGNISDKAATSVKYFIKMLSQCCETTIFMFLGLSTVSTSHHWDTAFIVLNVLFCVVYRAAGNLRKKTKSDLNIFTFQINLVFMH